MAQTARKNESPKTARMDHARAMMPLHDNARLDTQVIEADGLVLRAPRPEDAGPLALQLGDRQVAHALADIPHPLPPGAAEALIERARAGKRDGMIWVIDASAEGDDTDSFAGIIMLRPDMGDGQALALSCAVAPAYRGRGIATRAVAVLAQRMFDQGVPALTASVFADDQSSGKFLIRDGFEYVGLGEAFRAADGSVRQILRYQLVASASQAEANWPVLGKGDLVLRPLCDADAATIARLGDDIEIARMTIRVPHPYCLADAQSYIRAVMAEDALPVWAIIHKGHLVGVISVDPYLGYWIGAAYRGLGLARRAAELALAYMFEQEEAAEVEAGVFVDNAISAKILNGLGFREVGRHMETSQGRSEPVEHIDLVLSRADWEAAR